MLRINVLVQLRAQEVRKSFNKISKIEGVKGANLLLGAYNVIAYAELESVTELKKFMDKVRLVPGFIHADTCVAL